MDIFLLYILRIKYIAGKVYVHTQKCLYIPIGRYMYYINIYKTAYSFEKRVSIYRS